MHFTPQTLTPAQQTQARTNIGAGTSNFDGDYNSLANKPTIPTKTSDLTNDSDFTTKTYVDEQIENIELTPGPQGPQGEQGPQGPQGPQGTSGQEYIWTGTQAEYDALTTKDPNTLYCITNGDPFATQQYVQDYVAQHSSGTDAEAVHFTQQTLTSAQQAQARTNIGAGTSNFSGDYNDLTNKPTIPAAQIQSDWNQSDTNALDYIKNKPTLFSGNYNDLTNKPSLSTVATSGDYDDLTNKPTIPAAQVNSDWNASSGVAQILNKPALATVATSGSYNDLSDKPTIPSNTETWTFTLADGTTTTKTVYIQ